jgi:hypothetical protein
MCYASKNSKKSISPLGSYLVDEPNFCLIKYAFLYDFVILKKVTKNKDLLILGHPTYARPPSTPHHQPNM